MASIGLKHSQPPFFGAREGIELEGIELELPFPTTDHHGLGEILSKSTHSQHPLLELRRGGGGGLEIMDLASFGLKAHSPSKDPKETIKSRVNCSDRARNKTDS